MSEELTKWWSQKMPVRDIREIMRSFIYEYKYQSREYANAAREVLELLKGMKGKIDFSPFMNKTNHEQFLMQRAGMAVLNEDRLLFIYTTGRNGIITGKRIHYYG